MNSQYPTLPYPEIKMCRLVCSAPLHWSWNRAPPELSAQLLMKLLSKKVERSHCLTHTPPPFCASLPRNTLDITVTFTAEFRFSAPPGTPQRRYHLKPKIVTASQQHRFSSYHSSFMSCLVRSRQPGCAYVLPVRSAGKGERDLLTGNWLMLSGSNPCREGDHSGCAPVPPAELLVNAVPLTRRLEFHMVIAPPSLPALLENNESSTTRLELPDAYTAPAAARPKPATSVPLQTGRNRPHNHTACSLVTYSRVAQLAQTERVSSSTIGRVLSDRCTAPAAARPKLANLTPVLHAPQYTSLPMPALLFRVGKLGVNPWL